MAAPYRQVTHGIAVSVTPSFLPEQSRPAEGHYAWSYHVRIENLGSGTVQLRHRIWRITDALGRTEEVRGPGVVGQQPVLRPGESFEYRSGTHLPTPSGLMVGTYLFDGPGGARLEIGVPAFSLDSPHETRRVN